MIVFLTDEDLQRIIHGLSEGIWIKNIRQFLGYSRPVRDKNERPRIVTVPGQLIWSFLKNQKEYFFTAIPEVPSFSKNPGKVIAIIVDFLHRENPGVPEDIGIRDIQGTMISAVMIGQSPLYRPHLSEEGESEFVPAMRMLK